MTTAPAPVAAPGARLRLGALARWETLLIVVLVGLVAWGMQVSPAFLTGQNFSNLVSATMEIAIIALPMTLIIITGDIDLSVESMVGMAGAVLGWLMVNGLPVPIAIPLVLLVGALGGLLNGVLVTRVGIPALVVTLGTLALFRGVANVILGPTVISDWPDWFTEFGFGTILHSPIPYSLVVFAILGVVYWAVTHGTWIGRQVFAIGKNKDAARYSGVRVQRVRTWLFVLCGMIAALAGIILVARFSSARNDNGTNMTLAVVTVVVLGGVDINGGKGTIPGVILAVFTLAVLQNVLRLAGVSGEYQGIAIGVLLIVSVIVPSLARQSRVLIDRVRESRPPPAASATPGEVVS
jgi:rhamnose transport system permease protein